MIELEHVQEKYGKHAPAELVKFLYHGSSQTDPKLIYESEEGFDMRYANENGYWGSAVYFAQDSSYSNAYSFRSNGAREMFYAKVNVGFYKDYSTNKVKLKTPPQIEL